MEERKRVLEESHDGLKPTNRFPGAQVRGGWKIELPAWCQDQRNQMTGPADEAELVVKMLNSGAPRVMLDLEDSMVNEWEHQQLGRSQYYGRPALRHSDVLRQKARQGGGDQTRSRGDLDQASRLAHSSGWECRDRI